MYNTFSVIHLLYFAVLVIIKALSIAIIITTNHETNIGKVMKHSTDSENFAENIKIGKKYQDW